jgi:hypothetical protein
VGSPGAEPADTNDITGLVFVYKAGFSTNTGYELFVTLASGKSQGSFGFAVDMSTNWLIIGDVENGEAVLHAGLQGPS